MGEVKQVVDYVTEREARAIRGAYSGGGWIEYPWDMTIGIKDGQGMVRIPVRDVARFMDDWRRSGAWSLHGWGALT